MLTESEVIEALAAAKSELEETWKLDWGWILKLSGNSTLNIRRLL
jgi:hypothetical protein